MNSSNLVSIIMPAFNASLYIAQSIESVLAQTYSNWELLIVNDASTDSTLEIAQAFLSRDERIQVFDLSVNSGVSGARNKALESAEGSYIAFLDSDDIWLPEKLEKQIAFMASNGVDICYSWYRRIDEKGDDLGIVKPPVQLNYKDLLRSNHIGNLTGIYNAEKLGKEMLTDFRHEDYVAWLELLKRSGNAEGLAEVLANYRVYAGSTSSNKVKVMAWQWRIYRENQCVGFFSACALMIHYWVNALRKRV